VVCGQELEKLRTKVSEAEGKGPRSTAPVPQSLVGTDKTEPRRSAVTELSSQRSTRTRAQKATAKRRAAKSASASLAANRWISADAVITKMIP